MCYSQATLNSKAVKVLISFITSEQETVSFSGHVYLYVGQVTWIDPNFKFLYRTYMYVGLYARYVVVNICITGFNHFLIVKIRWAVELTWLI